MYRSPVITKEDRMSRSIDQGEKQSANNAPSSCHFDRDYDRFTGCDGRHRCGVCPGDPQDFSDAAMGIGPMPTTVVQL
jgi:hypothetical protein